MKEKFISASRPDLWHPVEYFEMLLITQFLDLPCSNQILKEVCISLIETIKSMKDPNFAFLLLELGKLLEINIFRNLLKIYKKYRHLFILEIGFGGL